MGDQRTIKWHEVDKELQGLETDIEHQINVQREVILLVFVPGIMGTRLRAAGTDGAGDVNGLPNMRWDPNDTGFMLSKFLGASGATRKRMLVGPAFSPSYLEVDNSDPIGNGFRALHDGYLKFLTPLSQWDWKPLDKIFEFPCLCRRLQLDG